MKKIVLSIATIVSLFAYGENYGDSQNNVGGSINHSSYRNEIQKMKDIYKLKEKMKINEIELQQKVLNTKIKMLNKKIKMLTTTPKKSAKDSVITYSIDPKIIVKTIDYSIIRKKPVYVGLLSYYESQKMLTVNKKVSSINLSTLPNANNK